MSKKGHDGFEARKPGVRIHTPVKPMKAARGSLFHNKGERWHWPLPKYTMSQSRTQSIISLWGTRVIQLPSSCRQKCTKNITVGMPA